MLMIQCIIGIPTCIMLTIWDGIPVSAKYWCCESPPQLRSSLADAGSLQHVPVHRQRSLPLGMAQRHDAP